MIDDELSQEHQALRKEQAALTAEHKRLERTPSDVAAHRAHSQRLQAHILKLHAHLTRLHAARARFET